MIATMLSEIRGVQGDECLRHFQKVYSRCISVFQLSYMGALADPRGAIQTCFPFQPYAVVGIRPHSSLKQHVDMMETLKNTIYLIGNSAHDCQNTQLQVASRPDLLTRGSAPAPRWVHTPVQARAKALAMLLPFPACGSASEWAAGIDERLLCKIFLFFFLVYPTLRHFRRLAVVAFGNSCPMCPQNNCLGPSLGGASKQWQWQQSDRNNTDEMSLLVYVRRWPSLQQCCSEKYQQLEI